MTDDENRPYGPQMPRWLSQRFRCPACQARKGQQCTGRNGQLRLASHQARVDHAQKALENSVRKKKPPKTAGGTETPPSPADDGT